MSADFLLPHLVDGFHVLDVGCGTGTITLGLATVIPAGQVFGVDAEDDFRSATEFASDHGIGNVEFSVGDVYDLQFPPNHFDACLCHSMLETLDRPLDGLLEVKRVLKPRGILGVACVEYGGLILAGRRRATATVLRHPRAALAFRRPCCPVPGTGAARPACPGRLRRDRGDIEVPQLRHTGNRQVVRHRPRLRLRRHLVPTRRDQTRPHDRGRRRRDEESMA